MKPIISLLLTNLLSSILKPRFCFSSDSFNYGFLPLDSARGRGFLSKPLCRDRLMVLYPPWNYWNSVNTPFKWTGLTPWRFFLHDPFIQVDQDLHRPLKDSVGEQANNGEEQREHVKKYEHLDGSRPKKTWAWEMHFKNWVAKIVIHYVWNIKDLARGGVLRII